jgi:hypothetical protein
MYRAALIVGLALWALGLAGRPLALSGDLYVIAHTSATIDARSVRDIYIGEKQFIGTTRITVLDNAAGQSIFLSKVLKIDQNRYASLWIKKAFRDALNPPVVKNSDKEILDIVRKTSGAIGYITSHPPADVTLVKKY